MPSVLDNTNTQKVQFERTRFGQLLKAMRNAPAEQVADVFQNLKPGLGWVPTYDHLSQVVDFMQDQCNINWEQELKKQNVKAGFELHNDCIQRIANANYFLKHALNNAGYSNDVKASSQALAEKIKTVVLHVKKFNQWPVPSALAAGLSDTATRIENFAGEPAPARVPRWQLTDFRRRAATLKERSRAA